MYTDFENIESTQNKGIQGTIDPYTIFNLSANYEINKKINLFLSGKNILDTVYIDLGYTLIHTKEPSVSSGIFCLVQEGK